MTNSPANSGKPALLVDVDGVISLFGFESNARPSGTWLNVDGIVHFLSGTARRHLLDLAAHFDLVWCTGWEEKANDHLLPALGLPGPLPFLTFDRPPGDHSGHWKVPAVEAYLGPRRPAAWIDDTHDEDSRRWACERPGPTLLVGTRPDEGLTDAHAAELVAWATDLAG